MATSPHTSRVTFGDGAGAGVGRPVLGGAGVALEVLTEAEPGRVWALRDEEVGAALGVLGEVVAAARAQLVVVLAEARRRSLGSGDGWGPVDWARAMAPSLPTRDLLEAAEVAIVLASNDLRLDEVTAAVADASSPRADERAEALGVGKAAQICRFHRSVRGLADPAVLAEVTTTLVDAARGTGGLDERQLGAAVRHAGEVMRPDRLVERDAAVRRAHRSLVKGRGPVGMWRYTLVLDDEGAAILDTAVDDLAKPRPHTDASPDTGAGPGTGAGTRQGERDPRTPAARRADALLDLVARAVGAPDGVPRQAKTALVVTVPLQVLEGRCRGAGVSTAGDVLTAGTLRRLACDAQVVPVVLGTAGQVLDQGTARRLFDRAQVGHLWLRDGGCSFPGCSRPAAWTDAHHLVHWADGGPTDTDNAALLCRAHHSVVHTHRYGGRIRHDHGRPRVVWDLTPDSYDTTLTEWRDRPPRRAHLLDRHTHEPA